MRALRIAILTSGRFWLCDLARELDALGHQVAFYSLVPPWRTARFGLPAHCNRWLLPWLAPFYLAARSARPGPLKATADRALAWALDELAARVIGPCDVFVGLSGHCTHTAEAMRRRFGAKVLVERGSRHILSQKAILDRLRPAGPSPVADWSVARELAEYALADLVVVPARHVVESFLEQGIPETRLFRNPYGVDLGLFQPTASPPGPPTVVMTGAWSLRKGCEILAVACAAIPGARLLHVGSLGDAPLPRGPGFEHQDAVDQIRLPAVYARGHVFALASREEGLALVQAQALASGLRLVCTTRTGGGDFGEFLSVPDAISEVPPDDPAALRVAIEGALGRALGDVGPRDLLGPGRHKIEWRAYGRRYAERLQQL